MRHFSGLTILFLFATSGLRGQSYDVPAGMIVFMAPECPICQYYTPLLKSFSAYPEFKKNDFLLAFTTGDSLKVAAFERKYQTGWKAIWGEEAKKLAQQHKASVTPELAVLNVQQRLLYRGRLSDAYVAPGRKRLHVGKSEIDTLFQAYRAQLPKSIAPRPAIGCLMNP